MMGAALKAGPRDKSGRIITPKRRPNADVVAMLEEIRERATVVRQPHRRGDASTIAESPLGRFCLAKGLCVEVYQAGLAYAELSSKWRGAWGAPRDEGRAGDPLPGGTGQGPTSRTAGRWLAEMRNVEAKVAACGPGATTAVRQLVIDNLMVEPHQHADCAKGLCAMAVAMGTLTAKDHPY